MATLTLVYWRDIPSQVIAKAGRKSAKVMLSDRFQEAIDIAAMKGRSHDADAYLEDWRREPNEREMDDLDAEVKQIAADIEAEYDDARLKTLVDNHGHQPN